METFLIQGMVWFGPIGIQLEMADNVKLSGKTRCLNFLEILLIHITLPTWDCVNDLKIASIAISEGHHR